MRYLAISDQNSELFPEVYGAKGDGVTDDSACLSFTLLMASMRGIPEVHLQPNTYLINSPLLMPAGVTLVGSGWREGQGALGQNGTILKRGANVTVISVVGTSILLGGPHYANCSMREIILDGGNFAVDMVNLQCASYIHWHRVFCRNGAGRLLYMQEVYDSRFVDCSWEWGGTADGTVPGVEINSGAPLEFNNQLMFFGCRWEAMRGVGLKISGSNTNEIWFNSCKIESANSNFPTMDITGANIVHFDVQLSTSGDGTATIPASLKLTSCTHVSGFVKFEHIGTVGDGATSNINAYLAMTGCKHVSLTCDVYGSTAPLTALVTTDGANANTIDVLMRSDVAGVVQTGLTLTRYGTATIASIASEPGLYLSREDINDPWSIGRLQPDGTGTKLRLVHNTTAVLEYGFDNVMKPLLGLAVSALWNAANFLKLGSYRIWIDSKDRLRYKSSAPSSDVDGVCVHTNQRGATAGRPTDAAIGETYFDTTLGKPIWLKAFGVWVDGSGTTV